MPESNVMVVAGEAGAKSTFGGGLLRHVEKRDDRAIATEIEGNEEEFEENVINRMWSQGKYPKTTEDGYVATYSIGAGSYRVPTRKVKLVDLPGEQQENLLDPEADDRKPLIQKITDGDDDIPGPEAVASRYEEDVEPDFKKGQSPENTELWRITFLHHYYNADGLIFLINLHKLQYKEDSRKQIRLAYRERDVRYAEESFSDVAIIPTAVDIVGYDPETDYNPGVGMWLKSKILLAGKTDPKLRKTIQNRVGREVSRRLSDVLAFAHQNRNVDFFSVSVPDQDEDTGNLTPDDDNGFVVKGFGEVVKWIE